jgi:hypothetical protein
MFPRRRPLRRRIPRQEAEQPDTASVAADKAFAGPDRAWLAAGACHTQASRVAACHNPAWPAAAVRRTGSLVVAFRNQAFTAEACRMGMVAAASAVDNQA